MPPELKGWEPEEKSPLPIPKGSYLEYEAAMAWGYNLRDWQHESLVNRAKATAHFLLKTMREGYIQDMLPKSKKKKPSGVKALMGSMGINPR